MLGATLLRRLRVAICRVQHFSNGNCGRGLNINKQTGAIYQEYGKNVFGGTSPIMVAKYLDRPLLQTVQEAMKAVRPDVSSAFVPQLRASDDSDDGGKDPCKPKKPKSDPCKPKKSKKSDPCKKKKSDPCKPKKSKKSDPCKKKKSDPCGPKKPKKKC